ncbi:IclR family transcriptional regulator [Dactylosporangium sp. CA-092794]|uniref:IclR family transcriptional regulator n=1 Tax=Dactylosporangium sp. CA-092794 TaxID=3239929 RepID=UPI003D91A098
MDPTSPSGSRQYTLEILNRAIVLLEAMASDRRPLGLSALSRLTGIPKTTTDRLMATLCAHDLVVAQGRGYRIGPRMARLADLVRGRADGELGRRLTPCLVELYEATGDLTALAVPHGDDVLVVQTIRGPRHADLAWDERPVPAHCRARGRVLIAARAAAPGWRATVGSLPRCDPRAPVDARSLAAELRRVRRLGYAQDRGDGDHGVIEVAVPVFGRRGPVAALVRVRPPGGPDDPAADGIHRRIAAAASVLVQRPGAARLD